MKRNKSLKSEPAARRLRTGLSRFPRILLWISAASATAIGCGWFGTQHSVRFNAYQSEREMGRLPPLPTMANGLNDLRASWEMDDDTGQDDYTRSETDSQEVDELWDHANLSEQAGDLSSDRDLLRQYLERTTIARNVWFSPKDRQRRRNSALDRLDALKALEHGSSGLRVRAYLNARRSHDAEKPDAETTQRALEEVGSDPNLSDNVAYLKAAELYQQNDFGAAAKAFGAVARRYPRSEKRESAVFMSAVALMKTSVVFASVEEAEPDADESAGVLSKPKVVVDEAGRDAMAVFRKLSVGNGQFTNDARGWLAYLKLHSHDRAGALVEYYRLLGAKHDESTRIEAAFSLQLVRGRATDDEMSRVELALEHEPDAALAYAYHNIYNYAIDPGTPFPPYDDEEIRDHRGNIDYEAQHASFEEREKQWQKKRAATGRREMLRVLDFSSRLIRRYPHVATSGGFALRAAQASLELGNNETAVQFAQRAIQSRVSGNERAQALWTNGVAEYRLRHFEVARKHFTTLLRDYPTSSLVEGARRLQAMIAEDSGDIDGALEQYLALDYGIDVAYFVDVLLTTDQLAGFIQRHPDSRASNELIYALGLRYLRANRWADARQTFAKVKISSGSNYDIYGNYGSQKCDYGDVKPGCDDPKEPDFNSEEKAVITPSLIMHDVQTANDLETLERAASEANGDEARAEALYQLASYQFEASSLLFYNPIAWRGGRYWNLSELAGEGRYRAPNEPQILWRYMQEHDRLARALKIYLEVVKRFPKTRAAPDALYTAAVCHERLSNSNPYWRDAYEGGLHAGERMVTYADVKAAYPRYQLPRGTYDWEPATRTVNGGPGWSAPPQPPKPKPKPTRLARVRKIVFRVLQPVASFWELTGRHWALVIFLATATVIAGRVSARTRAMLRSQIVCQRLRENCGDTYPWMILFRLEPIELTRPERAKLLLRSAGQRAWSLARDAESRPVLVVGIIAHSLLAWSFVSLVQTLLSNGGP